MDHDQHKNSPILTFNLEKLPPELRSIYENAVDSMSEQEQADVLEYAFEMRLAAQRFLTDTTIGDPREVFESDRIKALERRLDAHERERLANDQDT